jgi:hypothetical protein
MVKGEEMKSNWFQRNTGSPIRLAFSDCECRYQGRPHCFGCVVDPNYEEQPIRFNNNPVIPVWRAKWIKTHLTPADVRFLNGQPEIKPFYQRKRRPQWQRPTINGQRYF